MKQNNTICGKFSLVEGMVRDGVERCGVEIHAGLRGMRQRERRGIERCGTQTCVVKIYEVRDVECGEDREIEEIRVKYLFGCETTNLYSRQ